MLGKAIGLFFLVAPICFVGPKQIMDGQTVETPVTRDDAGYTVSQIKIYKGKRELHTIDQNRRIKKYRVALGFQPKGAKRFEGDGKTPEGRYYIDGKNNKSKYYKNLGISYPNNNDIAYARSRGKSPGGDIKIHGLPNHWDNIGKKHLLYDWTYGCIAVTNEEIDELFKLTPIGIPVDILP